MIKLLVLDVDGCLTDGKIIYSNSGEESKNFNVKDGFAITNWIKLGGKIVIITGRKSQLVEDRAKELGIQHLFQGIKDKKSVLENLLEKLNLSLEEVAAIGDELNDYKLLACVGRSFTPQDGAEYVKNMVDVILTCKGGEGAVREMIDIVVKENNQLDQYLDLWI
jgi:3-deoxy-D-manno-octulosonate 8-phosphate phosphatase (KDO 8-P phosphatase)